MKCNNCGFVNASDVINCIKCNSPLNDTVLPDHDSSRGTAGTLLGNPKLNDNNTPLNNASYAKTIIGEQAKENYIDRPVLQKDSATPTTSKPCPNCGYQLMSNARFCPNCNADVTLIHNSAASKNYKGTIDPYSQKSFSLRPIVNGEPSKSKLEFPNGTTVLNRDNTIKDNMTITSKEQAEIKFDNGEWFLVDKSEKQTTFLHADEPKKLKKGDIILLGDTKFIFE